MKKWLLRYAGFTAGFVTLYIAFMWLAALPVLDKYPHLRYLFLDRKIVKLVTNAGNLEADNNDGANLLRFQELRKTGQVDILALGSSHCYMSFDPRVFSQYGLSSFALGSGSQTPLNSYYLLKTYFPQLKPKLVILDVYSLVNESDDGLESFCEILVSSPIHVNLIRMAMATSSMHAFNALTFEWMRRIWLPLENRVQSPTFSGEYVSGGYVVDNTTFDGTGSFKNRNLRLSKKQLGYLEKIIRAVQKENSKIVLVTVPYSYEYRQSFLNDEELAGTYRLLATKHHISYYDFNALMDTRNNAYFSDKSHLNGYGAETFCHLLMKVIKSDPLYQSL